MNHSSLPPPLITFCANNIDRINSECTRFTFITHIIVTWGGRKLLIIKLDGELIRMLSGFRRTRQILWQFLDVIFWMNYKIIWPLTLLNLQFKGQFFGGNLSVPTEIIPPNIWAEISSGVGARAVRCIKFLPFLKPPCWVNFNFESNFLSDCPWPISLVSQKKFEQNLLSSFGGDLAGLKKFDPAPLNLKFGGNFLVGNPSRPAEMFIHKFGLKYCQGWALEQWDET